MVHNNYLSSHKMSLYIYVDQKLNSCSTYSNSQPNMAFDWWEFSNVMWFILTEKQHKNTITLKFVDSLKSECQMMESFLCHRIPFSLKVIVVCEIGVFARMLYSLFHMWIRQLCYLFFIIFLGFSLVLQVYLVNYVFLTQ